MYPTRTDLHPSDPYFPGIRQASPGILVSVVLAHLMLKFLYFSSWFLHTIALPVENLTNGYLPPATLAGLISLVVLVAGIMMCLGSLRLADLGLDKKGLLVGMAALGLVVGAVHLLGGVAVLLTDLTLQVTNYPTGQVIVATLDSFVGAAITEEVFYRGFLLVQVYFLLCGRTQKPRSTCLVLSLVLTQAYFGVNHLGSALRMDLALPTILGYLGHAGLVGAMLAVLFIRTRSIFVPMVAHGLLNLPITAIELPIDADLLTLVVVCLLMLGLPYVYSRDSRRFVFTG